MVGKKPAITSESVEYIPMIRDLPLEERPRERLLAAGPRALSTSELLAIILRTGSGGENVVRLAERLLAAFGDLAGIHRASITELQIVKGIGPAKAIEIKAALELGRRLLALSPAAKPRITSPSDAANLVMAEMSHLDQENLRTLLLDMRNNVLKVETVYIGSLNKAMVRVGEVFKGAIKLNAAALIVIHNHPSGDPTPSREDILVTREIEKAGNLLDVKVLDHLIIGQQRYVSMREQGVGFSQKSTGSEKAVS